MRRFTNYGPSLIVLVTAALVLFVGPFAVRKITFARTEARIEQAALRLEDNPILEQLNQAYRDIASLVEPSVVHISAEQLSRDAWGRIESQLSTGSGWVYDEDGHIVTNHHVGEDARRIEVQLHNGELRDADLVGFDESTDIAVLKVDSGRLHPAVCADVGEPVRQGDLVFAFGSPFDFRFSMSSGVVSGKGRTVRVIRNRLGQFGYENFIQVDAAINPGNSGGPLTDYRGCVIGMNTAIATGQESSNEEAGFAGIGLAIPMSMIEPVVSQLIENGVVEKGFLGISAVDYSQDEGQELLGLGFTLVGLVVGKVEQGSAADAAGFEFGDIITGVDQQPVRTVNEFRAALRAGGEEGDVPIRVWRFDPQTDEGEFIRLAMPSVAAAGLDGLFLVQVNEPAGRIMELMGYHGRGVRVVRCEPGKPARAAGVRRHDIITHVNDEPIDSMAQLQSMISSIPPGDIARLKIWRLDRQTGAAREIELEVPLTRLNTLRVTGVLPADQSAEHIVELGIQQMATATEEFARRFDMRFHPGVIVLRTVPGSELDRRVVPGSTIIRVMDRTVTDVEGFLDQLRQYELLRRGVRVSLIDPSGATYEVHLHVTGD